MNITFTALTIGFIGFGVKFVVTILEDPLLVGLNKIVPTVGITLLSVVLVMMLIRRWRNGAG